MSSTPHDALFKSVFGDPKHAAAQLQSILPQEVCAAIRWSTLRPQPGSFVDAELAGQHCDLLFTAQTEATGDRAFVYLLFEHQSTNDHAMCLRLLQYKTRIWARHRAEHPGQPLPVIVPAVLAQTPGGWSAATRFADLFGTGLGVLARYGPDFAVVVDDLSRVSDEELRSRALTDLPRVTLWLMRDARDAPTLLSRLAQWAPVLEAVVAAPSGREAMLRLLRYVALVCDDVRLEEFRDSLKGRAPATESLTMTMAEQLIAQGKLEGEREGKIEGKIDAVLLLLDSRGLALADGQREAILACDDAGRLDRWLVRAASASRATELFED